MQNNFVAFADARYLQYLTSTGPGSFRVRRCSTTTLVIGIHHSGGMPLEPGRNRSYLRNAGSMDRRSGRFARPRAGHYQRLQYNNHERDPCLTWTTLHDEIVAFLLPPARLPAARRPPGRTRPASDRLAGRHGLKWDAPANEFAASFVKTRREKR
ncbi:MAG: hypothetical protein IPK53_12480 [bacterium]|nr:hypothetical protein [bacterium]